MNPSELTYQFLQEGRIMQLATSQNDEPWVCTVHFYADDQFNLYWVSRTDRHHSQQIAQNPQASATILVHENTPAEDYVIAITISGHAELLEKDPDIREAYTTKLNKPPALLPNAGDPNNLQKFYRLKPNKIILFDTQHFPQDPRQELAI